MITIDSDVTDRMADFLAGLDALTSNTGIIISSDYLWNNGEETEILFPVSYNLDDDGSVSYYIRSGE